MYTMAMGCRGSARSYGSVCLVVVILTYRVDVRVETSFRDPSVELSDSDLGGEDGAEDYLQDSLATEMCRYLIWICCVGRLVDLRNRVALLSLRPSSRCPLFLHSQAPIVQWFSYRDGMMGGLPFLPPLCRLLEAWKAWNVCWLEVISCVLKVWAPGLSKQNSPCGPFRSYRDVTSFHDRMGPS